MTLVSVEAYFDQISFSIEITLRDHLEIHSITLHCQPGVNLKILMSSTHGRSNIIRCRKGVQTRMV